MSQADEVQDWKGGAERRRKKRINERCKVAFRLIREGQADAKTLAGETLNISESGVCLVLSTRIEQDTDLAIELALEGETQPLVAMGRVVWCDAQGPEYRVGICFSWLRGEDKAALSTLANYIASHGGD